MVSKTLPLLEKREVHCVDSGHRNDSGGDDWRQCWRPEHEDNRRGEHQQLYGRSPKNEHATATKQLRLPSGTTVAQAAPRAPPPSHRCWAEVRCLWERSSTALPAASTGVSSKGRALKQKDGHACESRRSVDLWTSRGRSKFEEKKI